MFFMHFFQLAEGEWRRQGTGWGSNSPRSQRSPPTTVIHQAKLATVLSPHSSEGFSGEVFPGGSIRKESTCNAGDPSLIPWSGRSPGKGNGNQLQYSCLRKSHGQRGLVGYSPWGRKSWTQLCN